MSFEPYSLNVCRFVFVGLHHKFVADPDAAVGWRLVGAECVVVVSDGWEDGVDGGGGGEEWQ